MEAEKSKSQSVTLRLDFRYISIFLLVVIVGMLFWWRPWQDRSDSERFVTATGDAIVEAEPDKYTFSPHFEKKGTDRNSIKDEITTLTTTIVQALKDLGVEEQDMTLSAYSYDNWWYYEKDDNEYIISADLEIVIDSRDLAQSVQDYLLTTEAQGQLTPYTEFSEQLKDQLESQAREQAINNAKAKAEQSASLLNARLGDVLEVDEHGFDDIYYGYGRVDDLAVTAEGSASNSMQILPGQNEFSYSVDIKFALK